MPVKHYNQSMKKLYIIALIIFLAPSSCYGAFFKKQTDEIDTSKGYVGTLPDLTKENTPSESAVSPPIFDKTKDFNSANEIKPIPRDDPAFVNIILKQDKVSPYVADLQEFIDMFEQIYESIDSQENVQRFAARVYFLNKNAEYFRDKYANKPESSFVSYEKILELSAHAKSVSELRTEAEKYKPYLACSGSGAIYNSNNIDQQLDFLKAEVEEIINMLKETK